jgi:hypothetical protein
MMGFPGGVMVSRPWEAAYCLARFQSPRSAAGPGARVAL